MKTNTSTRIAAAVLATGAAAAITGGVLGTGAASAAVPEQGNYIADVYGWWPGTSVGTVPASIHSRVLTIGGLSGTLTPTDHGSRTTIAGVPVVLDEQLDDGAVIVTVGGGAAMGQLIPAN